jgi:hypothetical protein
MDLEGLEVFLGQLEEFRAVVLEGRAGQGIEIVLLLTLNYGRPA